MKQTFSSRVVGLLAFALLLAAAQSLAFADFSVLVQGEDMTLASDMEIGEDAAAFGGKYIHVPQGIDTRSPVAQATMDVEVPADGTYTLWLRMFGPDGDSDAMYAWINDSAPIRLFPPNPGEWFWLEVAKYNLSAGVHTLKVGHGEIRARVDALYLTDTDAAPPESASFSLLIEGESLTLTPALSIAESAEASGGKYIFADGGLDTRSPVAEGEGVFSVPADGSYTVWVRMFGPDGDSDAMYVWIDNTPPIRFFPPNPGEWFWLEIQTYNLSAGEHTVYVGKGETGAQIDAIFISDDPANAPN